MSESFESLTALMDSHGMTIADLEYIVKYLIQEKISPQLAMRRIKSFETLKQKLEDNSDQDALKNLQEELSTKEQDFKSQLNQILEEKTSLEEKKQELEKLTDLFDTEREELRNQLKMMQELQQSEMALESNESVIKDLASQLIQQVSPIAKKSAFSEPITVLLNSLNQIVEEEVLNFDTIQFELSLNSVKVDQKPENSKKAELQKQEPDSQSSENQAKQETKTEEPKKAKIDPQVERVLNLFLDFLREANTDKDFQNRIDTICEMDEAYEHLGSIGLSQVYSFVSKDLSKKDELIKLLEAWKVDGVPR